MPKLRRDALYEIGLASAKLDRLSCGDERDWVACVLGGVAAMLDEATKPKAKKAKGEEPTLVISPKELFETIRDLCGSRVLCEPYDSKWFGRVGKALKDIPDLQVEDRLALVGWINSGALDKWPVKPNFGHCIKHLSSWIASARRYRTGTVGAPKVESAFK
jgi:hypothetical protein